MSPARSGPVAVIGGGVIGLAAAYYLRRAGLDVVVLERDTVGSGASHGNAGWIVPTLSAPLPGPGQVAYALRSMADRDSPLYVKPTAVPGMVPWLLRFAARSNARDNLAGLHATARLAAPTMRLYDEMAADGVSFEMHSDGLLYAHLTEESARHKVEELAPLREHGYAIPERPLNADAVHELEPALSDRVVAGTLIDGERYVEPDSLVRGLAARVRGMGVDVREASGVDGFTVRRGRVETVEMPGMSLPVGGVLLAAGAWSTALARSLGVALPMQAGKGYSFNVEANPRPRRPVYLAEASVGCTPINGTLRLAGTMELSGVNMRLDPRRVEAIVRTARGYLAAADWDGITDRWVGMRPVASDGLPILGRFDHLDNAYVATGHSMLGVTLAAATGAAMAELVSTGREPDVLRPFRPSRF